MQILMKAAQAENVANSLCCYLFKIIHNQTDVGKDFKWLQGMHRIYQDINAVASLESSNDDTVAVDVPDYLSHELAQMIENYLIEDIRESLDEDVEWLNEMMSIHAQLTVPSGTQRPATPTFQPQSVPQPQLQTTPQTQLPEEYPQPVSPAAQGTRNSKEKKVNTKPQSQSRRKETTQQRNTPASKPAPSRWDNLVDEDDDSDGMIFY